MVSFTWKIFLGASVASTARVMGSEATSARDVVARAARTAMTQQGTARRRLTGSILDRDALDPPLPFLARAGASIAQRERLGPEEHGGSPPVDGAHQLPPERLVERDSACVLEQSAITLEHFLFRPRQARGVDRQV